MPTSAGKELKRTVSLTIIKLHIKSFKPLSIETL